MKHQQLARRGEEYAAELVLAAGYQIRERNYRCTLGEIDLIIQKGHTIVFVEVKTRRGLRFGAPYEAVLLYKQKRLKKIALWYAATENLDGFSFRFDIISLVTNGETWESRWFTDAFQ